MENQPVRLENGDYRMKSSGGGEYYIIEMFGEHAASCECAHFRKGHRACKHMQAAEDAERARLAEQGKQPEHPFLKAELTRRAGFELLKS